MGYDVVFVERLEFLGVIPSGDIVKSTAFCSLQWRCDETVDETQLRGARFPF